ncbi:hypothetical protein C8F01DRAFT_1263282 [Mycena amicta]|nr:hypothetical protein C8F01DRAFT_1263282 [Mycena amicta]
MAPRKHHTEEERQAARRATRLRYDHSQRGRAVRRQRVRSTRRIAKTHISRLRLPDLVEDWACADLRNNYEVFEAAHTAADDFDESEFTHWLERPPFNASAIALAEDPADYDQFSNWYVSCAVDGCLLRREQEREALLKEDLANIGRKKMVDQLRDQVRALLAREWVDICAIESVYAPGTREHTMYERHVIFLARRIYRMYYLKCI